MKKICKKMIGSLIAVLFALLIAGCTADQQANESEAKTGTSKATNKDTLVIGLDDDPPQLDPHLSSAAVDRQVFQSLFNKLIDIDEKLEFVPELAKTWEISPDGKTYTFTLEEDVLFHDGTPFNAEAVKFNFERMLNPDFGSPRKSEIDLVDQVNVVSEYEVEVVLKESYAPFLSVLTDRAGMMVSPKASEELGEDFSNKPVGTGPYKFEDRVVQDRVELVRFEDYWGEKPTIEKVVIKPFTDSNVRVTNLVSGDLDMVNKVAFKDLKTLEENKSITLLEQAPIGYQGIYFNIEQKPFDNKKVRQAINAAIDREAIAKVVFHGGVEPAVSPFPSASWAGSKEEVPKADLELAKKLLDESGVNDVSFSMKIVPKPEEQQTAQMIQTMLKEIGVEMKIEQVEFGTLLEQLASGEFQAGRLGWSGRIDPDGNVSGRVTTDGPNNYSNYSNEELDRIIAKARTLNDREERAELYQQVTDILWEDMPYAYLYHEKDYKAMKNYVKGFKHIPDTMIRTQSIYFEE